MFSPHVLCIFLAYTFRFILICINIHITKRWPVWRVECSLNANTKCVLLLLSLLLLVVVVCMWLSMNYQIGFIRRESRSRPSITHINELFVRSQHVRLDLFRKKESWMTFYSFSNKNIKTTHKTISKTILRFAVSEYVLMFHLMAAFHIV